MAYNKGIYAITIINKTMKTIKKTKKHRYCKYCDRLIPIQYNLNEHIKICKNIDPSLR